MRSEQLLPEFVDAMPERIEEGKLYVSIRFRTAAHLCACGCGSRIITPIKPAKWKITYDGESVSLWPSVGNWQKPCRSHYVIKNNEVQWCRDWSDSQVAAGRDRDQADLRHHYRARQVASADQGQADQSPLESRRRPMRRLFTMVTSLFRRRS